MQRPFFHKLILTSTIQNRQLRIPENFTKKYRDGLSSFATLTVPDGHIWRIGLRKADNKIWFHDSWQDFVEHYAIRVGYFLVFRYEGNSAFSVFIYNLSTCEINYQYNTEVSNHRKRYNFFEEMEDDDSVEIIGISSPFQTLDSFSNNPNTPALQNLLNGSKYQNCVKMGIKENMHSSVGADHLKSGTYDTSVQFRKGYADEVSLPSEKQYKQSITKTEKKRKKTDPYNQEPSASGEEEADMRLRFYESASARKRTVTAEERERALSAAKTFEPLNPFCRVVLRPSYLYRGCIMYLPSGFAEKNLNGVSGFIKLQLYNGKQWPVRCLYKGGRAKLSQGWYEFTLENNLAEGDVCVFELLNTNDIVLQVTAFRVIEDSRRMNQHMQQHVSPIKLLRNYGQ